MFSLALGSKQPFLSRDTPSKSHVVAVVYSLRMVFLCTQAFKLVIIDHVRKQYEPGRFRLELNLRIAFVMETLEPMLVGMVVGQ